MKYINNKFSIMILLLAVMAVSNSGCKKGFLDVNSDPNRVTDANITPELLFPQAAHGAGVMQANGRLNFLENWMGYWSPAGDYSLDQTETSYLIDQSFGNGLWLNYYDVLFDLYTTKVKALANNNNLLAGASMILSARLYQDVVDIYGDVPYSQAFQNGKYLQPTYDKGKDVYAALQVSLDTAIAYMNSPVTNSFKTTDIVNKGNTTKWIKFANTLKLRLCIHQSEVAGFNPATEIAKIVKNGGVLHAGETVAVNPGYINSTNKQSPFYADFGLTPGGVDASSVVRANDYFVKLLTSTSDPRLFRFYMLPAGGGTSIVGTVYGVGPTGVNADLTGAKTSKPGPGLARDATQDQWIFTSFESMFLEAEAIARGWMTGNAQNATSAAIKESFAWLAVPSADSAATAYMTNNPIANWANAGTTVATQAKFIAYQKYIALCGTDPVEAWSDLRRLNMIPNSLYTSKNAGSNALPIRLLYPSSETSTNAANVKAEGTISQFTSKIFWQP
jgi:hypothetical protein